MDLNNFISKTFTPELNMYSEEQIKDLMDLFEEVGPAHHKAYSKTDGYDPDWQFGTQIFFTKNYGCLRC